MNTFTINMSPSNLFELDYSENKDWEQESQLGSILSQDIIPFPFTDENLYMQQTQLNDLETENTASCPLSPLKETDTSNSLPEKEEIESDKQQSLRFEIIIEAATAVTQKTEKSSITYLNRGQLYGIQLRDQQGLDEVITSTLSIDFHSPSHRKIAESYWTSWVNQQQDAEVRAIDIDEGQSIGVSEVTFPSFDKITFKWNGKHGSKINIRFKCLSTDFSKIKGVKGIPLRVQMDSFIESTLFKEVCYCKVKLFRDKGAERKNKDDAKQISRHLEKVYGKADEESLPLMYHVSLPYSVFGEIPTTPENEIDEPTLSKSKKYHTRVITTPEISLDKKRTSVKRKKPASSTPESSDINNNASASISPSLSNSATSVPLNIFTYNTEEIHEIYQQQQHELETVMDEPDYSCNISNLYINDNNINLLKQQENVITNNEYIAPLDNDNHSRVQTTPILQNNSFIFSQDNNCFYANENYLHTPNIMDSYQPIMTTNNTYNQAVGVSSIYDIFTPDEIQQPISSCNQVEMNQELPVVDYFCQMDTKMSIIQQKLQFYNTKIAEQTNKKKRKRLPQDEQVISNYPILTFSSNSNHVHTLDTDLHQNQHFKKPYLLSSS